MTSGQLDDHDLIRLLEYGATHSSFSLDEAKRDLPGLDLEGYLGKTSTSEILESIKVNGGYRHRLSWKALAVFANVAAVRQARRHADAAELSAKQAGRLALIAIALSFVIGIAQVIVAVVTLRSGM